MKILKKLRIAFSSLLVSMILFSCQEEIEVSLSAENHYHLKVDGAYLPVLVRGNTASNVILLFVQGGPGLSSIDAATVDFFEWENSLERDVAIAYYDQRGVGNKQGKFDLEQITMDQYIKDLGVVVQFLRQLYPDSKVVLFGHSFGGHLSYRYVLQGQVEVDGLISMAGPATHDGDNVAEERWNFRRAYLLRVSDRLIEMGINPEVFEEARDWLSSRDAITTKEERDQWNEYVIWGFQGLDGTVELSDYFHGIFSSSLNVFATLNLKVDELVADRLIEDEKKTNILTSLQDIKTPTLLLAGEFDDISPAEELTFVHDQIGSDEKSLHVLENAGHDLFFDQPEEFRVLVLDFLYSHIR